ncbi:hypothetical protein ACWEPA_25325 [Streptomyces filamentosus]
MPRNDRDPLGLGATISMMMTERGLVAPTAGGIVLAQWETFLAAAAPELHRPRDAGEVRARTPAAGTSPPTPRRPARRCAGVRQS